MMDAFISWRKRHFVQQGQYNWRPNDRATEQCIRNELAKHAVAIKLEEAVQGIPEPLYSTHRFSWDDAHFHRIRRFAITQQVALPDGQVRVADTEGSFLSVLRQLTSGLIYSGGVVNNQAHWLSSSRIDALETIIEGTQGPVLVAAFFKAEVQALLARFGSNARAFVGDTNPTERVALIEKWNADHIPVLIAAPGAMGHGINLQHGSCRTLVWFTHSFDWAQRAQFNARLVRSGQSKTISIINLMADAGLDQAVLASLDAKRSGERAILDALDIRHRFTATEVAS
jgi:hypothetical protein